MREMDITDEQVRMAALAAMEEIWASVVLDPEDYDSVTAIFEQNGFGWQVPEGYRNQKGAEYCGHTVALAFRRVGDHLVPGQCVGVAIDPRLASRVLSSTARLANRVDLDDKIEGRGWEDLGYSRKEALVADPEDIQPGDIVVVVTSGNKDYGDHITMAASSVRLDGTFETIEGNARGKRGDGSYGKGVVKRTRDVEDVRQVFRLGKTHMVGLEDTQ